jgi:iron(III) transport system substrate-binding protein
MASRWTAPIFGALVAFGALTGCVPRAENEVVLYSAADREVAAPILAAFERRHAETKVAATFDVESTKTVGLVTRIENEAAKPRCDLFWNNEILHTQRLEDAGLLQAVSWDVPSNWPKEMRSKRGTWIAFAARARILIVNRELLPDEEQWPRSVLELSDAKWHQKCAVALPLFGTTATHFTILQTKLGAEKAAEWFRSVKQNAIVLSGNKQVAQAVSSGQAAIGLTDTDDALIEIENGLPVSIVFPDQQSDQFGTLLIPNTLCVVKGCPHPNAARALGNYLLSENIEGRLAMGPSGNIPVRPGHPQKSRAAPPATTRYMEVDYSKAAAEWESAKSSLRTIFRGE